MYALVDCNNFYCSCERVFNPKLEGKPVVVLSNNDGCAIARSEEAKQLGIAMGTPYFMIQQLLNKYSVAVFSSNYTLYGDMSDRVMNILSSFVPRLEIYSIDEAYLDLHDLPYHDLQALGLKMRRVVRQWTGIPVCVGIAPTRTLAKMANHYAKKKFRDVGVFSAATPELVERMLKETEVSDVCGVGHKHAQLLRAHGFKTAWDFAQAPEEWVRMKMSVVGQRLLNELRGIPAIEPEYIAPAKKNICTSRSFGSRLEDKADILEALVNYAATCAQKLRQQKSCCRKVHVFLHTNAYRVDEPQYMRSIEVDLETPSNSTSEIIKYASRALDIIYKAGYKYLKTGIIVMDLVPEHAIQGSLFDSANRSKQSKIMAAMDKINKALGKESVRMAVQGFEKSYRLKAEFLSPRYTTRMRDILKVR